MKNIFIDWSHVKEQMFLDGSRKPKALPWDKILPAIKSKDSIFLEEGCPSVRIFQLCSKDAKVYMINQVAMAEEREKRKIGSSDEESVILMKTLQKEGSLKINKVIDKSSAASKGWKLKGHQRIFNQLTRTNSRLENAKKAFERNYGKEFAEENFKESFNYMKDFTKIRDKAGRDIGKNFKEEKQKLGIDGVGELLLGQILILAHPSFYPKKHVYLAHCGYKGSSKLGNKKSEIHSLFHQCASGCVKAQKRKDGEEYKFYKEVKDRFSKDADQKEKYEALTKSHKSHRQKEIDSGRKIVQKCFISFKRYVDNKALNRLATRICGKVYDAFYGG